MAGGVSVGGGERGLTQNRGKAGGMDGGAAAETPLVDLNPNDTPEGLRKVAGAHMCVCLYH